VIRFLVRFLLWSTALALPCLAVMGPYQTALVNAATATYALAGVKSRLEVDLHEPMSVGVFIALCLASQTAPARLRWRAVLTGIPTLFLVALLCIVWLVGMQRLLSDYSGVSARLVARFVETTGETVPWIAAPSLWVLLLGRRGFPHA
jgi:hypothetical protein